MKQWRETAKPLRDLSLFHKVVYMEPKDYILTKIEGDYATLTEIDGTNEMFIALALLPAGSDVGVKLHFENFEYSII